MQTRVCCIYPWATYGGVERVLINRAMASKALSLNTTIDVYYLHDGGGLSAFKSAIEKLDISDYLRVTSKFVPGDYDLVSLIDCPQAMDVCRASKKPLVLECHTAYAENRAYLNRIGNDFLKICVPSEHFAQVLRTEFPKLSDKVFVLKNFVPWDIGHDASQAPMPKWTRRPLLFFGRMDALKNPSLLIKAFKIIEEKSPGTYMLVFCGPESPGFSIKAELSRYGATEFSIMLPPVPFSKASALLKSIVAASGIFVSPSKGESFGLAAAEAISVQLPVLLSDIDAHRGLVQGNCKFLFALDDVVEIANKIIALSEREEEVQSDLKKFRENFSAKAFAQDWRALTSFIDQHSHENRLK